MYGIPGVKIRFNGSHTEHRHHKYLVYYDDDHHNTWAKFVDHISAVVLCSLI